MNHLTTRNTFIEPSQFFFPNALKIDYPIYTSLNIVSKNVTKLGDPKRLIINVVSRSTIYERRGDETFTRLNEAEIPHARSFDFRLYQSSNVAPLISTFHNLRRTPEIDRKFA